jgi:hypothetical protein
MDTLANPEANECANSSPGEVSSPLLRLPGEIRNSILAFALHEKDGLHYSKISEDKSVLTSRADALDSSNQLKFVSRQLYEETAGLELRYNKVNFLSDSERGTAGEQFLRFTRMLGASKISWLSSLSLRDRKEPPKSIKKIPETLEVMEAINSFCLAHPACNVSYIFSGFDYDTSSEISWDFGGSDYDTSSEGR